MARKQNQAKKHKKQKRIFGLGFFSGLVMAGVILFCLNFAYQLVRKPAEVISLLNIGKNKTLRQTWRSYQDDFIENSTSLVPATYLAALAQVESAGNPLATPQWNFNLAKNWKRVFSPASSSVGLYQFTEGTFDKASKYCIHNGKVKTVGPWYHIKSCWFNGLYSRLFPSHSIEVTSSYLHVSLKKILKTLGIKKISKRNVKRMASLIHLCGYNRAFKFAKGNFSMNQLGSCGSHSPSRYIKKVESYERVLRKVSVL